MSDRDWLAEHGPADDDEAREAAFALLRHRDRVERFAQLDALTPLERALAQRAAAAGAAAVLSAVEKAIGPSAETVNAGALRAALLHTGSGLDFSIPPGPPFLSATRERNRAAELVAAAVQQAVTVATEPIA